ncbi:MAG: GNAT family N-acetyltransferase [Bacillota bacterium]
MFEYRNLKPNELEAWYDFVSEQFTTTPRQYFANHFQNDPSSTLDGIFVALENNQILSTLRVFGREIYLSGKKIQTGGIGEVCTRTDARGQNLSSSLLDCAIEYMNSNNLTISTLRTGIFDFYRRKGWETTDLAMNISDVNFSNCEFPANKYKIRPVNWENDIPKLIEIHSKVASKLDGVFVRQNPEYWKQWTKTEAGGFPILVLNMSDEPVAYLFAKIDGASELKVLEFCALPTKEFLFDFAVKELLDEIQFPAATIRLFTWIPTRLAIKETYIEKCNMVRLNKPFEINGSMISNSNQLSALINSNSGFHFFNTDDY